MYFWDLAVLYVERYVYIYFICILSLLLLYAYLQP